MSLLSVDRKISAEKANSGGGEVNHFKIFHYVNDVMANISD